MDKYKDILGKPGEGFHKPRFLGFALLDILGTILIAFAISHYTHKDFVIIFTIIFILG